MDSMLQRLGLKEGEAIIHPWINKALERAQQKVEARHFDVRKNLLKFDDVMNDQRKVIFEQRIELMSDENVSETIIDMRHDVIAGLVARHIPEKVYPEQWETEELAKEIDNVFKLNLPIQDWAKEDGIADEEVQQRIIKTADEAAAARAAQITPDIMRRLEKAVLLQTLDHVWREHLVTLDHLRQVIGFRGYAQRDPLNEYKTEAFELFQAMLTNLRRAVTTQLAQVQIVQRPPELPPEGNVRQLRAMHIDPNTGENEVPGGPSPPIQRGANGGTPLPAGGAQRTAGGAGTPARAAKAAFNPNDTSTWGKIPRNAPCPCGSGKKFKHCHGQFGATAVSAP
jgi:preprotein translocase subunit SecA